MWAGYMVHVPDAKFLKQLLGAVSHRKITIRRENILECCQSLLVNIQPLHLLVRLADQWLLSMLEAFGMAQNFCV